MVARINRRVLCRNRAIRVHSWPRCTEFSLGHCLALSLAFPRRVPASRGNFQRSFSLSCGRTGTRRQGFSDRVAIRGRFVKQDLHRISRDAAGKNAAKPTSTEPRKSSEIFRGRTHGAQGEPPSAPLGRLHDRLRLSMNAK